MTSAETASTKHQLCNQDSQLILQQNLKQYFRSTRKDLEVIVVLQDQWLLEQPGNQSHVYQADRSCETSGELSPPLSPQT